MVRDLIRSLLGTATEHAAEKPADPDDLIALSRTMLALETKLGYEPMYEAGLAFADVDTTSFEDAIDEVRGVIHQDDQTEDADVTMTDTYGTQWIHITDSSTESLVANLQYGASAMQSVKYGSRLLAAAVPLEKDGEQAYLIYSFKRGKFYPFVPTDTNERDEKEEMRIEAIVREEIDVEEDKSYWYPLWPEEPGLHPWDTSEDSV